MKLLLIIFLSFQLQLFSQHNNNSAGERLNHSALLQLFHRVLGDQSDRFKLADEFRSDTSDAFRVKANDGTVIIYANSSAAFTRGLYHYLKNACNAQITWAGANLDLPAKLPDYESGKITSPYPLRLYYNVCTFGYTTAFWDWSRWERELDWMALHGINMPLAMNGQEAIWQKVWNSYGISNEKLKEYFTGPAFLPWHRMGNINKHGGPLPQHWIDQNKELQKNILQRMRELGMKPIVPAFSGFVPASFSVLHKDAQVIKLEPWTGFSEDYGTYILHPNSPYFKEIGRKFIEEYKKEFGDVQYYLADSFNELKVPVSEENRYNELADFGNAVFESIQAGDKNGIWVMQGWLFYNDSEFWDKASVKALLSKIPDNKMIIIDLANEYFKGWKQHEGFYGKQWIYSIIHNFGGSTKLFGDLDFCAKDPSETLNNKTGKLIGFGLSPEGIENNEIIYELLTDASWRRDTVDTDKWIKEYCLSRYGSPSNELVKSWNLLNKNIYTYFSLSNVFLFQRRPFLSIHHSNWDPEDLITAAQLFLQADSLKNNPLYRNDLVDVVGNLCGYKIDHLLRSFLQLHKLGEIVGRDKAFHEAKRLCLQLDDLYNFQENKRMSTWINFARERGNTLEEKDFYESNAKRQVTVWGGPFLSEYAAKLWSGLIKDYYFARWEKFYDSLRTGTPMNFTAWEENWINTPYHRQSNKNTDLIKLVHEILNNIEKLNLEESELVLKLIPDTLISEQNLKKGIITKYFEGSWDVLPEFIRENSVLDTVLNSINISFSRKNNDFGIQYTGLLKINEPGIYSFSLESDDGSKLYVNNKEVIDNDGLHAPEAQICELDLGKGFYHLRVDFFQKGGGKSLKLYYKTKKTSRTEVPAEMLYYQPGTQTSN